MRLASPAAGCLCLFVALLLGCGGLDGPSGSAPVAPIAAPDAPPRADTPDGAPAPTAVAPASRCPEDVERTERWPGEWPGPIVQVDRVVTLEARTDACLKTPDTQCEVQPGLYHPWANVGQFASYAKPTMLRVKGAYSLHTDAGPKQVPVGDEIRVAHYIGEGFCELVHEGVRYTAECPRPDGDDLEVVREGDENFLQVFKPPGCDAWIDGDGALLERDGLRPGKFGDYGEVVRAE